jgi:hypothetical protein
VLQSIQITNYEVGIVFPLKNETQVERVSCFQRPPKKYGAGDLPWVRAPIPTEIPSVYHKYAPLALIYLTRRSFLQMQEESRALQESFRS